MIEDPEKTVPISLRLLEGWSKPVENRDPENCDIDGARLWISPGGQVYCDLVHLIQDGGQTLS